MCGWCNVWGHITDERLANAISISTKDIISPGSIQAAFFDKSIFERAHPYLQTLMTPEETVAYDAAVTQEDPKIAERFGTGLLFVNRCAQLRALTDYEANGLWKQCSPQQLLDAGVCTDDSTVDNLVLDGDKLTSLGTIGPGYFKID